MAWFVTNGKTKTVTQEMPVVNIRERLKKVEISGHSRMTDPGFFYQELTNDLSNCFRSFNRTLILEFRLEYLNTGSSKWIFHMLAGIQALLEEGGIIRVVWYYEEDDEVILETGEVLRSSLDLEFELKEIKGF
jgi:hypothetical protein